MSEAKHTPGPWYYQENSDAYTHIVRAGDRFTFICQLAQDASGRSEANARLIAAAPALVEALRQIAEHPHNSYEVSSIEVADGHRCAAAIARAALELAEKGSVTE